jgi:CDP-6-deoxy-D-xylo-4-hexulose-3-dehydrase
MTFSFELTYDAADAEDTAALEEVIASRRFTMGAKVAEFERAFAAYHGMQYGVMVNSGSSANLIGVGALFFTQERPLQRGDEVIVPAVSWSTTYTPLQQYGLKLRFVDIEIDTLNADVSKLEAALTPRTRMIVGVSILGNPARLDVMRDFAAKHGLYFFEDNCESLGAKLNGQQTGTFGHINTFSFFFSHQLSTYEGGMVLTNSREQADLCRCLRAHGWTRDLAPDSPIFKPRGDEFFEAYRFIYPGYNVRPVEFSGALGLVQLKKLAAYVEKRRENLAYFRTLFEGDERYIIQRENGYGSSFCFPIVLRPGNKTSRRQVLDALKAENISHRIITGGCFTRHETIKHYDYEIVGTLQNAEHVHDQGFFVGNAPVDLRPQLTKLRQVLDRF